MLAVAMRVDTSALCIPLAVAITLVISVVVAIATIISTIAFAISGSPITMRILLMMPADAKVGAFKMIFVVVAVVLGRQARGQAGGR